MKRERAVFALFLVVAAIMGLVFGWWLRGNTDDSLEQRVHHAVDRVRNAFRSLPR